jgi:hypothetical protein
MTGASVLRKADRSGIFEGTLAMTLLCSHSRLRRFQKRPAETALILSLCLGPWPIDRQVNLDAHARDSCTTFKTQLVLDFIAFPQLKRQPMWYNESSI